jgi:hypothetical protein
MYKNGRMFLSTPGATWHDNGKKKQNKIYMYSRYQEATTRVMREFTPPSSPHLPRSGEL